MPREDYTQSAFDALTISLSEVLEEIKPKAAIEFAQWNLELTRQPLQVTAFSSSYDPGKKFEVTVVLGGGVEKRMFQTTLP